MSIHIWTYWQSPISHGRILAKDLSFIVTCITWACIATLLDMMEWVFIGNKSGDLRVHTSLNQADLVIILSYIMHELSVIQCPYLMYDMMASLKGGRKYISSMYSARENWFWLFVFRYIIQIKTSRSTDLITLTPLIYQRPTADMTMEWLSWMHATPNRLFSQMRRTQRLVVNQQGSYDNCARCYMFLNIKRNIF